MKNKIIPFLLCTSLMCSNITEFADETEFNASEAFKSYASFDNSQVKNCIDGSLDYYDLNGA